MIAELIHHAPRVLASGVLFRNFLHGGHTLQSLKQLYAAHGMLRDEHADLELVKLNSVEEMSRLLSGPTSLHCEARDVAHEAPPERGDIIL